MSFCSCEGERWTEASNVSELKKGCFGDVFYMFPEGEGSVRDDNAV